MSDKIRKAVFPVAGLGTRFLPATKTMPKEMLTLVDKPLVQYAIEEAKAAGIEEFIFVTSRGKSVLEDHFDSHPELAKTLSARNKQKELAILADCTLPSGQLFATHQSEPLGLGHAVWCARKFIGREPFAIILPDDVVLTEKPCLQQMVEAHAQLGGNMVAVVEVLHEQTNRYGILQLGNKNGRAVEVKGLVEKPQPADAPSNTSIIGRYILQPEVFDYLEEKRAGAGGEIQLTDSMAKLIGRQAFHGYYYEGQRYDCGDKAGYVTAQLAFALARQDLAEEVKANIMTLLGKH